MKRKCADLLVSSGIKPRAAGRFFYWKKTNLALSFEKKKDSQHFFIKLLLKMENTILNCCEIHDKIR